MEIFNHHAGAYLSVEGADIYYEQTGNKNGKALVLLHGGFGNITDFNTVLPAIDPSLRIIGIDSRGQGKSTLGNTELSYERLQQDVETILTHLGIEEAGIFGISDGGIAAYRLAAYSRLKVNKLITIGARWHRSNVAETYERLSSVTADSWEKKFPQTVELYRQINPQPDFNKLAKQLVQMWLKEDSYPGDDVKNIKAHALIIRGDKDPLTTRKFVAELANLIDNASLCNLPFAGHEAHREQSSIINSIVRQFLAQ